MNTRKLNKKAKMAFNIFGAVVIVMLAMFTIVVVRVAATSTVNYELAADSIIYDKNNLPISITAEGALSRTKSDNYSLSVYGSKKEYPLGKYAVAFETAANNLKIYGNGYQVFNDGSVQSNDYETVINDFASANFYKLADRRYVLTGNNITSDTGEIKTEKFVYVVIDRLGNAQIMNDTINLKTMDPITLKSGSVEFNVAEELLELGDKTIDLTKILGTSSQYVAPPAALNEDGTPAEEVQDEYIIRGGSGGGGGRGGDGGEGGLGGLGGEGGLGGGGGDAGDGGDGGDGGTGGTGAVGKGGGAANYDFAFRRNLSLRSVEPQVNSVSLDYAVTDPASTFGAVYAVAEPTVKTYRYSGAEEGKRIELNSDATNAIMSGLNPGTQYTINLGYHSHTDDKDYIVDMVKITTRSISANIRVELLAKNRIDFTLYLDPILVVTDGDIVLYADGQKMTDMEINIKEAISTDGWSTSFDFTSGSIFELRIENMVYQGQKVYMDYADIVINNPNAGYSYALDNGYSSYSSQEDKDSGSTGNTTSEIPVPEIQGPVAPPVTPTPETPVATPVTETPTTEALPAPPVT